MSYFIIPVVETAEIKLSRFLYCLNAKCHYTHKAGAKDPLIETACTMIETLHFKSSN
jgi:hypothetical protein